MLFWLVLALAGPLASPCSTFWRPIKASYQCQWNNAAATSNMFPGSVGSLFGCGKIKWGFNELFSGSDWEVDATLCDDSCNCQAIFDERIEGHDGICSIASDDCLKLEGPEGYCSPTIISNNELVCYLTKVSDCSSSFVTNPMLTFPWCKDLQECSNQPQCFDGVRNIGKCTTQTGEVVRSFGGGCPEPIQDPATSPTSTTVPEPDPSSSPVTGVPTQDPTAGPIKSAPTSLRPEPDRGTENPVTNPPTSAPQKGLSTSKSAEPSLVTKPTPVQSPNQTAARSSMPAVPLRPRPEKSPTSSGDEGLNPAWFAIAVPALLTVLGLYLEGCRWRLEFELQQRMLRQIDAPYPDIHHEPKGSSNCFVVFADIRNGATSFVHRKSVKTQKEALVLATKRKHTDLPQTNTVPKSADYAEQ